MADAPVLLDDAGNLLPDAAVLDCSFTQTGWHPIGGPLSASALTDTPANGPDIAVDSVTGDLYVAWVEGTPADVHVQQWNGATWLAVGGPVSANPDSTSAYTAHLAARAGALVLAHTESGGETSNGFYVHGFNGAWQLYGGGDLSTASVNTSGGAVGFDDGGGAVAVWSQYTPGEIGRNRIHANRFSGPAYVPLGPQMGGIAGPGASALTPTVTFAPDGTEIVAFSESAVRVFERNSADTGWDSLGGDAVSAIVDEVLGAHSPRLASGPDGVVYLAMAQYDPETLTSNGYLMELSGGTWQRRTGVVDLIPSEHSYVRALTVAGTGQPVMAVTEGAGSNQLYIMSHNGGGFTDLGTMPLSAYAGTESVSAAALATDACGRVVVAFTEADTGGERDLHVYRFYE